MMFQPKPFSTSFCHVALNVFASSASGCIVHHNRELTAAATIITTSTVLYKCIRFVTTGPRSLDARRNKVYPESSNTSFLPLVKPVQHNNGKNPSTKQQAANNRPPPPPSYWKKRTVPHPDPTKPKSPYPNYPNYDPRQKIGYRSIYCEDGRVLNPSVHRDEEIERGGSRLEGSLGFIQQLMFYCNHEPIKAMGWLMLYLTLVGFLFFTAQEWDYLAGDWLPSRNKRAEYLKWQRKTLIAAQAWAIEQESKLKLIKK
jgi:hypothetical protein